MQAPQRPIRQWVAVTVSLTLGLATTAAACSSGGGNRNQTTRNAHIGAALDGVGRLPRPASAWPAAGYDARHSSATPATGPQSAHLRWRRTLEGDATPGPVLGIDGTVLAATNAGVLHALDPSTGKDVWTFDGKGGYGSDLSTSPAVLSGGTVLWPGPNDTLFALTKDGRRLWTEHFAGQVLSPAVAGRHRVYIADLAGHLTALEVTGATHRRVWTVDVGGTDYASATVGPDGAVYTASDDDLVAVRDLGATGAVMWRFHANKLVEVSNAVGPDGTIVLGTNHDKQYGVAPDGSVRWSFDVGDYTYSSSVVHRLLRRQHGPAARRGQQDRPGHGDDRAARRRQGEDLDVRRGGCKGRRLLGEHRRQRLRLHLGG